MSATPRGVVVVVIALLLTAVPATPRSLASVPARSSADVAESRPPDLRVATYNVCAARCPDLRDFDDRARSIGHQVRAASIDVLMTQESGGTGSPELAALERGLGDDWVRVAGDGGTHLFYDRRTMSSTDRTGDPLFRRTIETRRTGGSTGHSAAAVLRDRRSGESLLFVDLHLLAWEGERHDADRGAEMRRVLRATGDVRARHRTIVGGDLNSLSRVPADRRGCDADGGRTAAPRALAAAGLTDTLSRAVTRDDAETSSYVQPTGDDRRLCDRFHLDHLYASATLPTRAWDLTIGPGRWWQQDSDHRMVTAAVRPSSAARGATR